MMDLHPDLISIASALEGRKEGTSFRCLCPGHNGHSLIVSMKADKLLVKCQGGCSQEDVIAVLKERGLWPRRHGAGQAQASPMDGEVLEKEYEYRTAAGELVAVKGRFRTFGGKTFRWKVPGSEQWTGLNGRKESTLPLYQAHTIKDKADGVPVICCEGEKASDACRAVGLTAVCAPGGRALLTLATASTCWRASMSFSGRTTTTRGADSCGAWLRS